MAKDILFLGSSIVNGTYGVDWISLLPCNDGHKYHNFGINGAQVPGLIELVQSDVIKIVPVAVIIMVGGNDVANSIPFTKYSGVEFGRCGRPQTNAVRFGEEIEELIQLIVSKWGEVDLCVFNLKPASELIDGSLNKICIAFNESLRKVTNRYSFISYVDMFTPMIELLQDRTPHPLADDINHVVSVERMMEVRLLHWLCFGQYSYNDFGDARGFYLFCDGIHFNERAIEVVLKVIKPFMDKL